MKSTLPLTNWPHPINAKDCLHPGTITPNVKWTFVSGMVSTVLLNQYHNSQYVGRNRWRTLQKANHVFQIECWIKTIKQVGYAKLGVMSVRWVLPIEYKWSQDDNGVKIIRVSNPLDDYHPTGNDVFNKCTIDQLISILETNRATRQSRELRLQVERAELENVYVCVNDSLRAGNCVVGTIAFATRNNLEITKHYLAAKLLDIYENGEDYGRLRITLKAAQLRHKREMERGYSELHEHALI